MRAAAVVAAALVVAALGAEQAWAAAAASHQGGRPGFVGLPVLGAGQPRASCLAQPRSAATIASSTSRTAAAARGREGDQDDDMDGGRPQRHRGEGGRTPREGGGGGRDRKKEARDRHFEFLKVCASCLIINLYM